MLSKLPPVESIIGIVVLVLAGLGLMFVLSGERASTTSYDETEVPFIEIVNPSGFVNTDEITLDELVGEKVILVDFMTYSCVNCQRTFPYLNEWYSAYRDEGLEIVGIHTPEFAFERDIDNVRNAAEKFGLEFPLVLDNDYSTWRAYNNRFWPRKYLIDIHGNIVYDHIGEGAYDVTENKIVELLNERKEVLGEAGQVAVRGVVPEDAEAVDFSKVGTPETYLGAARIEYIRNLPSPSCLSSSCEFFFSGGAPLGYELEGTWLHTPEHATLESNTGAMRISFTASKVNLVAGAQTEKTVTAKILLDGEEVNQVTFTDEFDLYNLVDLNGEYQSGVLEIQFEDPEISIFAFTFG